MSFCGCAAGLSPEECSGLHDEMEIFEMDHLAELGRFHQLAVDAYGAQHADPSSIRLPYSLVGLYLALEKGFDGLRVREAHQRMGKPQAWWPRFVRPASTGSVTVRDVVSEAVRLGSVEHYGAAMDRWARSAWEAWSAEHARVADLTGRLSLPG